MDYIVIIIVCYVLVVGSTCNNPAYGESNFNLLYLLTQYIVIWYNQRLQANPAYEVVQIHCTSAVD